jgi:hypothetical protein
VESGIVHARYRVTDPFPGEATRRYLVSEQTRLGWRPRLTDIAGNSIAGPDDLQPVTVGTVGIGTLHWTGYWEDRKGNVVSYSLNYSCVSQEQCSRANDLEVVATLIPASEVLEFRDAFGKRR